MTHLPGDVGEPSPFVVALLVMIGLICVFPDIAMWLPRAIG